MHLEINHLVVSHCQFDLWSEQCWALASLLVPPSELKKGGACRGDAKVKKTVQWQWRKEKNAVLFQIFMLFFNFF